MTNLICRGTWVPIDRHAKLRKVVQIRVHDRPKDGAPLARWDSESQKWLDHTTGQPITFIPTEYLRT